MKLQPSSRINRRYVLFDSNNKEKIEQIILDYLGILGWAEASPQFIRDKNKLILAISSNSLEKVRASFALSKEKIKLLKVSGTLKGMELYKNYKIR